MPANDTRQFLDKIMSTLPESISGGVLTCTKWNFPTCKFRFLDSEMKRSHELGPEELLEGLRKFVDMKQNDRLPDIEVKDLESPESYGNAAVDAVIQLAIFEEIVYT